MQDSSFLKRTMLLTITNMTTAILGFLFNVILSRRLGAEGMGLYSLVFPISSLLLSIISGGMMTAVSRVIASYNIKGDYANIRQCIKVTLIFNLILSLFLIFFAYLFSFQLSLYVIRDLRTLYALRYLLIAIIFMSLSNTYKGYFFGTANVATPAFIDVFEKLLRIFMILILFKTVHYDSMEETITAAFLVFCSGELASLIFFFFYYRLDLRRVAPSGHKINDAPQLLYNILVISIPLMITELVASSLSTISTLIIPQRLMVAGFTHFEALSLIGKVINMSMNIVFFPMVIIWSISTVLVPDLAGKITTGDTYAMKKRIDSVIFYSFVIGTVVFLLCLLFGDGLGSLIYQRDDLGFYIKFLGLSAPIIYPQATTRGILNGLGQQKFILKYSTLISVAQVVLLYFILAIPKINIYGFGITLLSTTIIALIIGLRKIRKVLHD